MEKMEWADPVDRCGRAPVVNPDADVAAASTARRLT
jgi:hypothetical protein